MRAVRGAGPDEALDLARTDPQQGAGTDGVGHEVDRMLPAALRDQGEGVEVHPVDEVGPPAPPLPSLVQGGEIDDLEARDPFLGRIEVEAKDGSVRSRVGAARIAVEHHDLQMSSIYHAASSAYLACLRFRD